ncbi:c-type cytochrome, partial [Candidatus Chlorohelix sp.]|uniref:cytochrome c n=1 Tax=Candidatus Chlorohelix sp. TaxID=3139201 RepID=UPI00305B6AD0
MPTRLLKLKQSRNVTSVLGDASVQLTVLGVWFTGIAIGVVVLLLIVLPNSFGNNKLIRAELVASDSTNYSQIDPVVYSNYAVAGKKVFSLKCQVCHAVGGTAATGQGPRLDRSINARDANFIIKQVRLGVYGPQKQVGMPYFKEKLADDNDPYPYVISPDELYQVTVYLRSIQLEPRGVKPIVSATTAVPASATTAVPASATTAAPAGATTAAPAGATTVAAAAGGSGAGAAFAAARAAEKGDAVAGSKMFKITCQGCHSNMGTAVGPTGCPNLSTSTNALDPAYIRGNVRNGRNLMTPFDTDTITDTDLNNLVAFVLSINVNL